MYLRYLLLVLLAVVSSACVSRTTVRHSSDYQSVIARSNHEVLVMPPVAEVNMVGLGNKKTRMYDYEYHLEDIIIQEVIPALQEQGLRAKVMRRRDLHDQGLTADFTRLRDRYNEVRDQLYKETFWDEKQAFDISENTGPFATPIGAKNQGDLIVMLDYARDVKTSGARTADFMMDLVLRTNASQDADKSILIIGIIDAKTGKLLWTNLGMDMRSVIASGMIDNSYTEDELASKRLKAILSTIFKTFKDEPK